MKLKSKLLFPKFIFTVILACLCSGFMENCRSNQPITQSYIQQITQNPSFLPQELKNTTHNGCEAVPATGNKPQFEGQEYTGNPCFVKIHSNEKAEVSFVESEFLSFSLLKENSDTFVAQINNNEVLILQIYKNQVISATQTGYDKNNHLNYGLSGETGKFIKSCLINAPSSCTY